MRLKQIKLAGFKSFVDPTTVTLPGNRCAVVGPNGCGKSNIIDAVRWVMGESSAKQLRGESITDVIFSGSSSRKPTSVATIELLFDNSDGRVGGEYAAYTDIAIRRQVTRDAQSQYFLNGNKCRRRDIQDVFRGTGFGPRSYSIIEQGMISQLVDAKPEELRGYLEEAAGISKYKERRRETENRIKHTKENLERIDDIREELGRQIDRLQRQAKAAERYKTLRTDEALVTAQLYALRHSSLHSELQACEEKIKNLTLEQERQIAAQRELEAQIEQSRQNHAHNTDNFNEVQGKYYQLGADIARSEESIQFNQARVKQLELDLQSVHQRSIESDRQLDMDETQIGDLKERINELIPKVEVLQQQDTSAQSELQTVESELREWQGQWDTFHAEAAVNDRQAEVQASRIEHLEQLLQRLKRRQEELLRLQEQQVDQGSDEVDQLAEQIADLERQSRMFEMQIDECLKELSMAREDVIVRERGLEDARGEVQGLRHEFASLQAVQDAALGENVQEAASWIAQNDLQQNPRLGESLAVVPGWELAIEPVLGHFLSALQVPNLDEFATSLAELKEGDIALVEGGTGAGAGSDNSEEINSRLELPLLNSLLRSDDVSAGSLMHGVYAAESTQVALSKRSVLTSGQSIITREGFWVGIDWVRVLYDHDQQAGIIERGQQIETLGLRVEEAEQTLGELRNHVQKGRARVERLETQREELQRSVNTLIQSLSERRTDHGVTRVKVQEAGARRQQLEKESIDITEQVNQESERLLEARRRLAQAEQLREGQAEKKIALSEQRETLDSSVQQVRERARLQRDEFHSLNIQKEGLQSRMSASETARDRLLAQKSELEEQKSNLQSGIANSSMP
ncbi:MAG: chromosome segregation protein SMC, partial [Gammaproteobacteria bacterium]|nr:chromosome segregation protein SMC [Gammaproteobacteria bacterium]